MEQLTMLQSMLNILNSYNRNKKAVVEALPTFLETYNVHGKCEVYNLIVTSAQNVCIQIFNPELENLILKDSDISLDNLKPLLIIFFSIIKKCNDTDIIQIFQHCIEKANKIDFKNCSNDRIRNIEFCMQKLYILCNSIIDDCTHLNKLRIKLLNVLNEPYLNKTKLDAIVLCLNSIVSLQYIPILWHDIKPMIKIHPDRVINLIFNMQYLFFNSMHVNVILNDDEFWDLSCNLLNSENNIIRTYNNINIKLACAQLSNENYNYCPSLSREQFVKVWNDFVLVIETLENTQQHLTLPILSTAKRLALNKADDNEDYKLPLKWITAMYCKMAKHSSKYVVLASIDIITNMSVSSLKTDEKLLQSFVNSLNNIFLYKMSSEISVCKPQLEIILSLWFDKLMMSNDGHDVFRIFLSLIPTVKWATVPLIFLTKSLTNISLKSSFGFNIVNYVLKIKTAVEKMPNSYLKSTILSFLFIFTDNCFFKVNSECCFDLFDCITVYHKNTKSWDYIINSICKVNDINHLDKQLSQHIIGKHNMYSTSIGFLILPSTLNNYPLCIKKLDEMYSNAVNTSDLFDFLECLLEVENRSGRYDTCVSQILDKHIWSFTVLWVEKCLQNSEEGSYDDLVIYGILDKILSSNRINNITGLMKIWLIECNSILTKHSGNYSILAIYSWIGKYATKCSEQILKNNWLSFTKNLIEIKCFSLHNQGSYHSRKPLIHNLPQLVIINTYFQYSTVSEEQMLEIFDWLTEKTMERHDNYWSIYFSTVKTIFCKFPIQEHSKKIIQFIENCLEFLVGSRVSCFPNAIKSFIEMTFHYKLLSDDNYVNFVQSHIFENLLTDKYRDKFNVCFSLRLLKFFEDDQLNIIQNLESRLIVSGYLAKCIMFNIERYGAIKIEWDTLEYIRTQNNVPLINDIPIEGLPDDRYLRFKTIKCLYQLNSNVLWKNVINLIIKTESSLRDRKFFHNSKAYRIKQRVIQVLLIIACDKQHKSLIFDENVYKWSLSSLKEVSHIHSVVYQLIWLLVLIYNENNNFSNFWNDFKNAQENHNYLCSFISIVYHLCKIRKNKQFEVESKKHLLPLCFSNGYKVRFYAQVTIQQLISCYPEESEDSLLCKTIENMMTENDKTKKYENPFLDFFYQELHMINYLSLKNVCVEVPRLLNIVYEERFPMKWLNNFPMITINNNDKYDLSLISVSSFIEKNTASASSNEIIVFDNAQNAQRKYIPSQPLDERETNSSLVVVASLIDKVTNLGGLARTCQVFGASKLVVDNLTCVEKREFTALSMTAEKHQSIIEVRVKNLKSYLQKMKNEGYQIVAAEQTADSVKLHNIKLPFKCILLLGNETSGVPHDLLSIMDTCVEIEQLGIVRSLNVHVAGSLFIWEYTKQHCLSNTSS